MTLFRGVLLLLFVATAGADEATMLTATHDANVFDSAEIPAAHVPQPFTGFATSRDWSPATIDKRKAALEFA